MMADLAAALMNLESHQKDLESLSIAELRRRFAEVMGYESHSRSRTFLIRKILWGIQASDSGDISKKAKERALAMADERDLHFRLPKANPASGPIESRSFSSRDDRLPVPGTVLIRRHKEREVRVLVLENGFEWNGTFFKSLSSIARKATGTRWNGYAFFNLAEDPKQ